MNKIHLDFKKNFNVNKGRHSFQFRRTFILVIVFIVSISVLICLMFSLFYSSNILRDAKEKQISTYESILSNTIQNNDYLFIENLHQSLTQLSMTGNIYNSVFFDNVADDTINMLKIDIANTVSYNSLVKSAIVYFIKSNIVITNTYASQKISESPLNSFITSYYSNIEENATKLEKNGKISLLFYYNDSYYIAQDFFIHNENRLGTLFYELDLHEMNKAINNISQDNTSSKLYVFDESNNPVFLSDMNYPENILELIQNRQPNVTYIPSDDGNIWIQTSSLTGWTYLLSLNNIQIEESSLNITFILFIFAILTIVMIASVFAATILYTPFQQLFDVIKGYNYIFAAPTDTFKNEFDYLKYIFKEIRNYQLKQEAFMRSVSKSVVENLMLELISGKQITSNYAMQILNTVKSELATKQLFTICLITHNYGFSESMTLKNELDHILPLFDKEFHAYSLYVIPSYQNIAIILAFGANATIADGKKAVMSLKSKLDTILDFHNLHINFSSGHLYHSILDLGFSYKEACEATTQTQSLSLTGNIFVPLDTSEKNIENISFNPQHRIEQIINIMNSDNNQNDAHLLFERVIHEIIESTSDIITQISASKSFLAQFLNELLIQKNISLEMIPDELSNPEWMKDIQNKNELYFKLSANFDRMLDTIYEVKKNQANPHFVAAKAYIEAHYTNPNLSMSIVADAIGISPNYLGKLFASSYHEQFSHYLNKIRIEKSLELLTNSDILVKDIAEKVGYNSSQSYIRVFKNIMYLSPGSYRKKQK